MSAAQILAAAGALALAALLGVSDAPNAIAALLTTRRRSVRPVAAWSVGWHFLGGLLAGTLVARTTVGMVHVSPQLLAPVLGAGCWATVLFTWVTTRFGLPTSASVGLVGGLAGAGLAAGGIAGVSWAGTSRHPLGGVLGVLGGILLAPLFAGTAAFVLERLARRRSERLPRWTGGPIRLGVWVASAAVAMADGTNDGQKAMGVLAASVSGAAVLQPGGAGISWTVRTSCAALLAGFTVLGGREVITTVSRRLWHSSATDDLAAQASAAAIVFLGGRGGLPLSTSTVVTSSKMGAGMSRRPRHLQWPRAWRILQNWLVTLPACAILGAALFGLWSVSG